MPQSTAIDSLIAKAPRRPRPGERNVIAVASGKGGVGKTWFAVTLAHAFAQSGQRTLLFDGDLGLANVDIQLGLMPERDLSEVIAGRITLKHAVSRVAATGFEVIVGQSGTGSLGALPRERLMAIGEDLIETAADYDRVIVDLGAGVDRTVRMLTGSVGRVLVIATDEPTSLTDAYAFIKLLTQDYRETDIRIVINMAPGHREGERTYATLLKACKGFLKISPPLAGVVRRDNRVKDCIRSQTPLLTRHPNSTAAADVEAIARHLLEP